MNIAKEHNQWNRENSKFLANHKKALHSLNNLEKLIKKQAKEITTFGKKSKAYERAFVKMKTKGSNSTTANRRIKLVHHKQSTIHQIHARANRDIQKIAKTIDNAIRNL